MTWFIHLCCLVKGDTKRMSLLTLWAMLRSAWMLMSGFYNQIDFNLATLSGYESIPRDDFFVTWYFSNPPELVCSRSKNTRQQRWRLVIGNVT